jgi:hypothetical protein
MSHLTNLVGATDSRHRLPPDSALKTLSQAQACTPALVAATQAEYDRWDESDEDTYGGGGICHLIADELVRVLDEAGIEASSVSSMHEQHVYVGVKVAEGVYALDVPYSQYEVGSMFTWTKIQGVVFGPQSLTWYRVSANPDDYESYLE